MLLYHTGFQIIRHPDVHYGRKNADFGQGFYLTPNEAFARRWAVPRADERVFVNKYTLDESELILHRFIRDEAWFSYLFANRRGKPDTIQADAILGPIANDTIFDTMGIITSGFLPKEQALRLLLLGPEYMQITLKSEKAAMHLQWLSAEELDAETLKEYQKIKAAEEASYQEQFALEMQRMEADEP